MLACRIGGVGVEEVHSMIARRPLRQRHDASRILGVVATSVT